MVECSEKETGLEFTKEELKHIMVAMNCFNEGEGEPFCFVCAEARKKLEKMIENYEEKPIIEEKIIGGHRVTIERSKV